MKLRKHLYRYSIKKLHLKIEEHRVPLCSKGKNAVDNFMSVLWKKRICPITIKVIKMHFEQLTLLLHGDQELQIQSKIILSNGVVC